ncbi:DNA-3-methyladenine glycosylase I [Shewanella sp. Isolate11]|uniref:DNA-3-methyladenine glycosylase I n=1 Tax=Shewanella sp. Isolate11 TaxID=2908530 RepID=UPI001EFE691D|nr:DNA-3-methyladenine glycosylase I [Shewanella sp. Isolate11]MCG9698103.1 DNA-3-methyladenine glycosylase I [Shewanella sp. Isolate11]
MESFKQIYQRACERKGGEAALALLMPQISSKASIKHYTDAELLSEISRKVFQCGFVWRVVDHKWPAYEKAFFDFEPQKVLMLSPEQLQQRASDETLIRHLKKTQSIYDNALMIHDIQLKQGSFAEFIANWPVEDITGLWSELKRRGCRLGGNTGPYFLRTIGKDTFLLTDDIKGYFTAHKLIDYGFTSKAGLKQVQEVFNCWQQESGLSLAEISRIVACSVGDNRLSI